MGSPKISTLVFQGKPRCDGPDYFRTVCLADLQPNNIIWKCDASGNMTSEVAALIDFQLCSVAPCFYDMVSMLSTAPVDVIDHCDDVITRYRDALCKGLPVEVAERIPDAAELRKCCDEFRIINSVMSINMGAHVEHIKAAYGYSDEQMKQRLLRKLHGLTLSGQRGNWVTHFGPGDPSGC
jgi:hypothetical protein